MTEDVKVNSAKAWLRAARPKTLTGAMIPVLLAGAMAFRGGWFCAMEPDDGSLAFGTPGLRIALWVCCLVFACLMQVAANFINDIYDFEKGTDREDRLGPERACAQGWITPAAMRRGIAVTIAAACVVGLTAVAMSYRYLPWKGAEFVLLGILCVAFAFLYTTRLSYLGWGDVLVLVFFGFVPVCGTYYLLTTSLSAEVVLLSLIAGIAIDALLMINNYRDREQDRISGKRTLVVRFGERAGRYGYLLLGVVVTLLIGWLCWRTVLSDGGCSAPLLGEGSGLRFVFLALQLVYPVLHFMTWRKMVRIRSGKALNSILGETSRNMFVMAVLLSLALILV